MSWEVGIARLERPSTDAAVLLSDLRAPVVGARRVVARVARLELGATGGTWADSVAQTELAPEEIVAWRSLPPSPRRRRQWLLGRLATKDVVRALLLADAGAAPPPGDLVVAARDQGQPWVRLRGTSTALNIAVSIAHSADVAVAIGTTDLQVLGAGVDVEVRRDRRALERRGLTAGERANLASLSGPERADLVLRWWCAKEAAVKALGTGLDLVGGAQAIHVVAEETDSSIVRVEVAASSFGPARTLMAATRRDGDLILATVLDLDDVEV